MWAQTINSDELWHHGVKGQQWGVRNGPPYPLEKTKQRNKALKTKSDVDDIVNSLSKKERKQLGLVEDDEEYLTSDQSEHVFHRELKKIDKIPVSFFDMIEDEDKLQIALATRSGKKYRRKGYSNEAAQQAMKYLEKHPEKRKGRDVEWFVRNDNPGSIRLAEKLGFEKDDKFKYEGWSKYVNRVK